MWRLQKYGLPIGVLKARIYAITGTYGTDAKPTGSALGSSDGVTMEGLTTSAVDTTFTFSTSVNLTSGQYYCLVVEAESATTLDTSNYIQVRRDESSPTHSGNICYFNNSAWSSYSFDAIFSVDGVLSSPKGNISNLMVVMNLISDGSTFIKE